MSEGAAAPRSLIATILCVICGAGTLSAATFAVTPDRQMVEQASVIVIASAINSRTQLRHERSIETVTLMSVEDVLKGSLDDDTIEIHEPGGVYDHRATIIPGVPRFSDGERYLLFLVRAGGVWRVLNIDLGKFTFDTDILGHEVLVRDVAEIAGWDPDLSVHVERSRLAEPFLRFIRGTVGGGPAKDDYFAPAEPLITHPGPAPQPFTGRKLKPVPLAFTASTYTFIVNGSSGARWTSFPVTFFSVGSEPGAPGSPAGATAITTAFNSWNGDASSNVNYVYGGADNSGTHTGGLSTPDGQNTIAFERNLTEFGIPPFSCSSGSYSGTFGIAGFTDAGPGTHTLNGETFYNAVEGDVEMNQGIANCTFPGFFTGDFNSAVAHEVGHTLGFRHSDQTRNLNSTTACSTDPSLECSSSAIMKAFIPAGLNAALQTWDQHAVDGVYPNPTVLAPTGVTATAQTSTSVSVNWNTVMGASSYHVYRSADRVTYTQVGTPASPPFTDSTASANTAYLYKVRAFDGATESGDSNLDLATTTIFTDSSLSAGVTPVKAVHFTELRTAVDAVRKLANNGVANPYSYTDATLNSSVTVKAVHITDLRTALNGARSTLGLPAISYTDPTITAGSTVIRAVHITDLRGGVQ